MNQSGPKKKGRALKASYEAPVILKNYWEEVHAAKKAGRPIAYASGNAPVELLYAFDILPAYPENYAAVIAAQKMALDFVQMAESKEFSHDLCSYAKINLGELFWDGKEKPKMPFGGLPTPPDILVTTKIPCLTQVKWWEVIRDLYPCPLIVLDAPMMEGTMDNQATEDEIEYVVDQLKEIIVQLEDFTHTKFDEEKFFYALALSDQAGAYWHEIMDLRGSAVPCPVGSREMCGNVFSLVAQLGTKTPVDFYRKLRDELQYKVWKKIGAIPNEKTRLMLDNIPLWYNLELLSDVEEVGAIFVFETYLRYVWGGRIDLTDPYRGYAKKILSDVFLNMGVELRFDILARDIKRYKIDGVVFHSNRSCKRWSLVQYELKEMLLERLGVPSLLLEADHSDPSGYSESQTKLKVDAFLELIEERR
jgi:benzoyl-CoA reductase/2-hydroxyglutaryl-CoA dehydratase subunit BcrC/BadD/HgdB